MRNLQHIADKLIGSPYESLTERQKKVARHVAERKHIARNIPKEIDEAETTLGQRAADRVASFGGSWTFITIFAAILVVWIASNSVLLVKYGKTFDPYPFILLNLVLSMVAAIQAPIILMSQNRQGYKDRVNAEHDYEVNLKAELEIMMLHEKMDHLREHQWSELLKLQERQLKLLSELVEKG